MQPFTSEPLFHQDETLSCCAVREQALLHVDHSLCSRSRKVCRGPTWFSSCTSMLYWGPGCTSVTFSPRRKPRRVMSVFAASSTDGGGPSSCSVSPKGEEKQSQSGMASLSCCPVLSTTGHRWLFTPQPQNLGFQVIPSSRLV